MTQTPKHISASPGEKVQINCKSSSDGDSLIYWFQKKADQPQSHLIYHATNCHSGVPDRFSVAVDLDLTLTNQRNSGRR
ncbi:unnamed protein product [Staurois parvus]|uniref:Immunoglobulin V-set domain-containing protein n=1 Tax=Staurois parvus TaxID=386267 RepID=A0ABN9ASK5_9NEOB|nr:unnamed protein product [Staurois parvus]